MWRWGRPVEVLFRWGRWAPIVVGLRCDSGCRESEQSSGSEDCSHVVSVG